MPNITTNHLSAITYTNMTKNNEVADIEGLAGFTKSNRRSCEIFTQTWENVVSVNINLHIIKQVRDLQIKNLGRIW